MIISKPIGRQFFGQGGTGYLKHDRPSALGSETDEPQGLFEDDEDGVVYVNEAGDERVIVRDGRYVPQVSEEGYIWSDALCLHDDLTRQEAIDWVGP